ncbi:MAG: efflux transporter outer membrane subunit [Rhodocyclaceae bacterium]|nr:efflux transporter outer membrane subunit [Rhodocyclaceae bacterium]
MKPRALLRTLTLLFPLLLSGCALFQDHFSKTEGMTAADAKLPTQWQAPLPHDGKVSDLRQWWTQFDDPLLNELIAAAEANSPSVATARSRLYQARATSVGAFGTLLPKLDANLSGSRGQQDIRFPAGTATSAGLAASWEIDLFGGASAASDAASLRYSGAQADWHLARVSLAADVATSYIGLRACEASLEQRQGDAGSRRETARLTGINAEAGLESPANAALARASAAQGNTVLTQQRAQCEINVKALVALTAIDEPTLRQKLGAMTSHIPEPASIAVGAVPAAALAQRPDVYSATQAVLAASADVSNLQAQRLPRISLAGNIGHSRFSSDTATIDGRVWTLGPLTVTLPLFDAGLRRANVDTGRARYDEAVINYGAKLRGAVREVEEALINLQSANDRAADAQVAVDGFAASFKGVEARQRNGLASLFELEDARRSLITARIALIEVQRDRVNAWVSLYRALGGGWKLEDQLAAADTMPDATRPASLQKNSN